MRRIISYQAIFWTAVVAGVFSTVVCAVLVGGLLRRPALLALDEPEYLTLKKQLATSGDEVEVQQRLRSVDVDLREQYFRQQTFTQRGAYLLAGGLAVTLLLCQWAVLMRPRLPELHPPAVRDHELRENQLAQWASGAVAIALVFAVVGWKVSFPSVLQGSADRSPSKESITSDIVDLSGAPEVDTTLPTAEELARNWHRFRGPHGAGVAAVADVPQAWNGATGEGVKWKTPVPLPGLSSPIVWERRVFLTGADRMERAVFCFDTETGDLLWRAAVDSATPDAGKVKVDESTGYAAPTPVTDGRRVYAIFATGDVAAFSFDGKAVWSLSLGTPANSYGHAASLAIWQDLVIVQMDQGHGENVNSKLFALKGTTGQVVWETRRETPPTWSTPIVVTYEEQPRVITCGDPWVIAYDANTGDEIWRARSLAGEIGPSPVYRGGVVFVAGDGAAVTAIRDGGQGDVTDSHVLWQAEFGLPDICSPLVTERHVLLVASYGDLVCYDRMKGGEEPLWEESLGTAFGSPSLVGDLVYLVGEQGQGWVVRPRDTGLDRVAENDLGEPCSTCPSFQPGRIYIRGKKHLFCIEQ